MLVTNDFREGLTIKINDDDEKSFSISLNNFTINATMKEWQSMAEFISKSMKFIQDNR